MQNIDELRQLFREAGVDTIYTKVLSPKQDNDKNQIYFGKTLSGATNLFPAEIRARSPSESIAKRKSKEGQAKLEGRLHFSWLDAMGNRWFAPHAKIMGMSEKRVVPCLF